MTDEFMIGASTNSNPASWSVVSTLLSSVSNDVTLRALDWSFEPCSEYITLADGKTRGVGLPRAIWKFRSLRTKQRENLRDFCPGVSSIVYIRTPTNETIEGVRVWGDFLAIAHWAQRSEMVDDGLEKVDEIEITFSHLVAQT